MFSDVPGQERAKRYFANAFARGLNHAYLFVGESGFDAVDFGGRFGEEASSKAGFVLELAATIVAGPATPFADDASALPGTARTQFERASSGVHPDLSVIAREGDSIRLEQMQEIESQVALKPLAGAARVWVIPEADRLKVEAANKLLKTLEEPPPHVFFLLTSGAPERVLSTIVSRCQLIEFEPVSDEGVRAFLQERGGLDAATVAALARLSGGSVERAARLADDRRGDDRRGTYLACAGRLVHGDRQAAQAFINEVAADQAGIARRVDERLDRQAREAETLWPDPRDQAWYVKGLKARAKRELDRLSRQASVEALDHLISWLRDLWAVGQAGEEAALNRDHSAELRTQSVARPEYYGHLLELTAASRKDLYMNVDRGLALAALFSRFEEVTRSG